VAVKVYGTGLPYAPENCRNKMMFGDGELDGELSLMVHPVFHPQISSCCGQFFDAYDNLVPYTSAATPCEPSFSGKRV